MDTKRSSRSGKVILLAALALLLVLGVSVLAAVSGLRSPEERGVAIGEAPAAKAAIELPALRNGRVLPAEKWPDACELVNPADVKAILPEAVEIELETTSIVDRSIREFASDPEWKEADIADSGKCLYDMRLPGETYSATHLWVRIHAVADPKLIKRYYEQRIVAGIGTNQGARGADDCTLIGLSEGDWFCRKGPLMFSVGGQTTVAFEGKPAPAPFVWRDDVNPLIVETIAAKIR